MKSYLLYSPLNAFKILFLGTALFFICNNAAAQTQETTKLSNINLYVEASGFPGAQASINLEKRIVSGDKVTLYGRVGGGTSGIMMTETGGPGILGALAMLTGKKNNHFEISGGAFIGKNTSEYNEEDMYYLPIINLGYRYQKPEGGYIFKARAGFLGVGIGLGYAF